MNRRLLFFGALCIFLSSCGSSFTEGAGVDITDPNPAWVSIEVPTSGSVYTTIDNAIFLSGSAFVSEGYFHGPPWDSGVAVSWSNNKTGVSGDCNYYTQAMLIFIETKWNVTIPIEYGENLITITAYEYLAPDHVGNSDSTTIKVIRN